MSRYRVTIEYDGTPFVGWQRQENGSSVQQAIEEAVHRFCGETVCVQGAGRTDAGVHARGQVAHLDLTVDAEPATIRDAVNFHLRPAPIAILDASIVDDDFHARFSATKRAYTYHILNRRAPPTLDRSRVWWLSTPLDVEAMAEAAHCLIGRHDFTSFRSSMCQSRSPVKTLDHIIVSKRGDDITLDVSARSFLHNQVRIIVGTLKRVGEGAWTRADVISALAATDRRRGGPTAPAAGLYLRSVDYG